MMVDAGYIHKTNSSQGYQHGHCFFVGGKPTSHLREDEDTQMILVFRSPILFGKFNFNLAVI